MEMAGKIAALILLPLLWGLAVEMVFSRLRRNRGPVNHNTANDDWVI